MEILRRNMEQIISLASVIEGDGSKAWLRTMPDQSVIVTVSGPEALYKETETDATKWIYRDGFGLRRKYWYPASIPTITNIAPASATYTIDYQKGLITFSVPLTSTPSISKLQFIEDQLISGYEEQYNALRTLILNELSISDSTWKIKPPISGTVNLNTGSKVVEISSSYQWRLMGFSLEFETEEPVLNTKIFLSKAEKSFDKTFLWLGISPSMITKYRQYDYPSERIMVFHKDESIKLNLPQTVNSCNAWWNFIIEERI